MTTFERINTLAKKRGYGLRTLASKAGLGETTIYGWKHRTPDSSKLKAVADVLGVTTDYLINGETKNPSAPQTIELEDAITKKDVFTYQGKEIPDDDWEIIKTIIERHRKDK